MTLTSVPATHLQARAEPLAAPRLEPAAKLETAPALAPEPARSQDAMLLARPRPLTALTFEPAPRTRSASYAEMASYLEPSIAAQTAEVQAALDARGLRPEDVKLIYNVDVTGHPVQVCLACGVVGHDFRPTTVRQDNLEKNLLSESLVVFNEVARRVGTPAGIVAYDEAVLPLRAPGEPLPDDRLLQRFEAFLDRHDNKKVADGNVMDWMREAMATWNPADANAAVVGEPADRRALESAQKMLAATDGAVRGVVVAKGQVPATSLAALEMLSRAKDIKLSGIAVGSNAEEVAAKMFRKTDQAPDLHALREHLGVGIRQLVEQ